MDDNIRRAKRLLESKGYKVTLKEDDKPPTSKRVTEAYKIRYSYEGDELSDYDGNVIVIADSEDEAIEKAEKKYPEGWNFRIESEISDIEKYEKKFPRSNIEII